jgi:aryl-alcohol dehydrogenase-like predicted oxidoreductase
MSKLTLGTVQFGLDYGINNERGIIPKAEVFEILELASKNGIKTLDTAFAYGKSEEIIGQYLATGNSDFKIISKSPSNIDNSQDLHQYFEQSLKKLKVNRVYGYLFHDFDSYKHQPDLFGTLEELKKAKRVEKLGFSLYFPKDLEYLLEKKVPFDLVQMPYSVFDRRFENYFNELKQRKIEIYVRSVFLQGLVFKTAKDLPLRFDKIKTKIKTLGEISLKSGVPISALCLNFASLNDSIGHVVIGVNGTSDLEENLYNLSFEKKTKECFKSLLELKEDDENIILPINWK